MNETLQPQLPPSYYTPNFSVIISRSELTQRHSPYRPINSIDVEAEVKERGAEAVTSTCGLDSLYGAALASLPRLLQFSTSTSPSAAGHTVT